MEFKTILWPTDLSKSSLRALDCVKSLADRLKAEIVALYVPDDISRYQTYYGGPTPETITSMRLWEIEESRSKLQQLCQDQLNGCPGYRILVRPGLAHQEILRAVDELSVDMVVMAPHGRGTSDERLPYVFGSTTDRVVKGAPVPVLVVNDRVGQQALA